MCIIVLQLDQLRDGHVAAMANSVKQELGVIYLYKTLICTQLGLYSKSDLTQHVSCES